MSSPSALLVVGLSHRSCAAAMRERVFVDDPEAPAVLAALLAVDGIEEAVVLSTCDRVTLALAGEPTAAADALGVLERSAALPTGALTPFAATFTGEPAVRHLFAIAASLDSQVIGEPQVLGQLHASHRLARDAGAVGPVLEAVLQAAYGVAKRVRSETAIAERSVSIAAAAVDLAHEVHGALGERACLLIGPGELGQLVVERLQAAGLGRVMVLHHAARQAARIARRFAGHHGLLDVLPEHLPEADIVVSTIGEGAYVLGHAAVEAALRRRRRRPMFLVDLAVPGDIEPAVARIDDAFVYDLGDLERVAEAGRASREAAAEAAWRILDEELVRFLAERRARAAVPALVALRERFEALRAEILVGRPGLDAAEATRLLVNRLLHEPSEALRGLAAEDRHREVERMIAVLFGLDRKSD